MKPYISNKRVDLESNKSREDTKELEVYKWDSICRRQVKVKIQVSQKNEYLFIQSQKGTILKKVYLWDYQNHPDMFYNTEQIQCLEWQEDYKSQSIKLCKYIATWKWEPIRKVGGYIYSNNGFKLGMWKQPIKNYSSQAQFYEGGEYFMDQRCGRWNYIYIQFDQIIGGGNYQEGVKTGKWIDLDDGFFNEKLVIYIGEYKNGKKLGIWDIEFKEDNSKPFTKIGGSGGGQYDKGVKTGKWIDLDDLFDRNTQVSHQGEYKNGKKVGRWDIEFKEDNSKPFTKMQKVQYKVAGSGGGQYDEGVKIGKWIDLDNLFDKNMQVIYKGEYKNGKKFGIWDIEEKKDKSDSGGGEYDEGGKTGKWVDLVEGFCNRKYVTHSGEYKNGLKVGMWLNELKDDNNSKLFSKIGGGQYDKGVKIGKWIDLDDVFDRNTQVSHQGEYKNGKKVGRWDIWLHDNWNYKFNQKIGGGSYDEAETGFKVGNWVEISEGFWFDSQVTYIGGYKNGKKVGRWDICYQDMEASQNEKIGGGLYDEQGDEHKMGIWLEISDNFYQFSQVMYKGEYKNEKKVGVWVAMIRNKWKLEQGFIETNAIKYDN